MAQNQTEEKPTEVQEEASPPTEKQDQKAEKQEKVIERTRPGEKQQETFEGIDFLAISDMTGLENDEIKVLKICFNMFDVYNQAFLSSTDLDDILRGMGFRPSKEELRDILEEIDEDGSGQIEFPEFCQLCAKFLVEEPDEDTLKTELKEAFRIYDRDGAGFITTDQLREIISELDQRLTKEDLDGIIDEIDEDGSGTMDFDEFCAMMMSK